MKGSQICGSENGVHFIARKLGSKIGGVFFIARKSGVVFLAKIGEICEIGENGVGVGFRGRSGFSGSGWKLGMGKKWEGKMYRRARNVSYPEYSYISCNILFFKILIMGFSSSLSGRFSGRPYTQKPPTTQEKDTIFIFYPAVKTR